MNETQPGIPREDYRFSIKSLLIVTALVSVIVSLGSPNGYFAAVLIAIVYLWTRADQSPPSKLRRFSVGLFIWTGVKTAIGGLLFSFCTMGMLAPTWRLLRNHYRREINDQNFDICLVISTSIIFLAAVSIIASRSKNVAAWQAAPVTCLALMALNLPNVLQTNSPNEWYLYEVSTVSLTAAALVGGAIGDGLRVRRVGRLKKADEVGTLV